MLDNLNSKFESSRVQALDVNDDEVEIDLLEIFHALRKKILLVLMVALIGGCIGAACHQSTVQHPVCLFSQRKPR